MQDISKAKRIVIKIGTSTLTYNTGRINIRRFELFCKVLSDIKNSGKELIIVSSGAVSVGLAKLNLRERPKDIPGKQAAAAVGQCELMYLYDKMFLEKDHKVAQILLTRDDFENEDRLRNAHNTFETLLSLGAIPIVNENDSVATEELKVGDNDTLSAMVAVLTDADALIILSDIDGLYDGNPRENPSARLIPVIEEINDSIESIACGAGSNRGTGGMITKIQAAKIATGNGIATIIMNGTDPNLLYQLCDGKIPGSLFVPSKAESNKVETL